MQLQEIYKICNEISPFELQESWDNSGVQVGFMAQEIKQIVLSLDIDHELLDSLEENTLLITHHPLIFKPIKIFDVTMYEAGFIQKMIQKNIAMLSLHTNFDKTHLNRYVATEVLGYMIEKEDDFLLTLQSKEEAFEKIYSDVVAKLSLRYPKVVMPTKKIQKIALCTGSGASLLPKVDAELFLTGDIKYHDAMLAKALGIGMIDIGHFESEQFFSAILAKELKNFGIDAIISQSKNPFDYIV